MHLIEDDQLILVSGQIGLWIGQSGAVGVRFEVEVGRRAALADLLRERGLADLAGAQKRDEGVDSSAARTRGRRRRSIIQAFVARGARSARLIEAGAASLHALRLGPSAEPEQRHQHGEGQLDDHQEREDRVWRAETDARD